MSYAASKQFLSPRGLSAAGEGGAALSWELDGSMTAARQETWLLSFIDILALLLTLLVLLLAYQDQDRRLEQGFADSAQKSDPVSSFSLQALLQPASSELLVPSVFEQPQGFALPGEGLLPQTVEKGGSEPLTAATEPAAAAVHESPQEAVDAAAPEPRESAPSETPEQTIAATFEPAQPVVEGGPAAEPLLYAAAESGATEIPAGFEPLASVAEGQAAAVPEQPTPLAPPAATPLDRVIGALDSSALRDRIDLVVGSGNVSLEISDSILFAPASAALSDSGSELLDEVAALLQSLPYSLSVEGHTDNVPIQTARYPSNWELSSARAAAVTRVLIEKGVAPERVRAIGYGETRPRDNNGSETGRARNRRVSFVLQLEAEA